MLDPSVSRYSCTCVPLNINLDSTERPAARNKRQSPLHDALLEQGAVMGAVNGWERPNWFTPKDAGAQLNTNQLTFKKPVWFDAVAGEVQTLTSNAAMADLSVLSKFMLSGTQVQEYLDTLGSNKAPPAGRIGLTHVLTPDGGVQSEFTVSVLNDTSAYLTSASASERIDFDSLLHHARHYDCLLYTSPSPRD